MIPAEQLITATKSMTVKGNSFRVPKYGASTTAGLSAGPVRWTATRALLSMRGSSCRLCLAAGSTMTLLQAHVPRFIHPCRPIWAGCAWPGTYLGPDVCSSARVRDSIFYLSAGFVRNTPAVHLPRLALNKRMTACTWCRPALHRDFEDALLLATPIRLCAQLHR
jgi:hypothetical protein